MNNFTLFEDQTLIRETADLIAFIDRLLEIDIDEFSTTRRPDASWRFHQVTNMTFYLTKVLSVNRIGGPENLPTYILQHQAILSLQRDGTHGRLYNDNLWFFRCLSIFLNCKCGDKCKCLKVRERDAVGLFNKYKDITKKG